MLCVCCIGRYNRAIYLCERCQAFFEETREEMYSGGGALSRDTLTAAYT